MIPLAGDRVRIALAMLGVASVDDLVDVCEACLLDLPCVGRKTVTLIKERLGERGLSLARWPCARDAEVRRRVEAAHSIGGRSSTANVATEDE